MTRGLALLAVLVAGCPAPEPAACPEGQVQDADSGECVPEHCGSEPWGLLERTGETVHVAPWGDDDWDGSQEWPFRTIQEGANEAEHLVAVAAGTYLENLSLDEDHDGIVIAGRCPELVVIDGSGEEAPGVRVTGGELGLRGLTVTRGHFGLWVQPGFGGSVSLEIEDLVLVENVDVGLLVVGAGVSLEAVGLEVTATQPLPDDTFGTGIDVEGGASLVARDLLVEGNHNVGLIAVNAGTTVELTGAIVRDTHLLSTTSVGQGIVIADGANLFASDLVLERNHDVGLIAAHDSTRVDLEDVTVRDTRPLADGTGGRGIGVQYGASLFARGLLLEGNQDIGLAVGHDGTTADVEDAIVRDTQPRSDGTGGTGVAVGEGASLQARGLLLEGNHEAGLFAEHGGTFVDIQDATVRETLVWADREQGWGVGVGTGAGLVARRLLLERNGVTGLAAWGAGTTVELDDVTVRDTQPLPDGRFGQGISVQEGATLTGRGLLLEGNHDIGLIAGLGTASVDLQNTTVLDTRPRLDGTNGRGIAVLAGGRLEAGGLLLEGNHDVGLLAADAGTTVELKDATIRDTLPLPDGTFGRGIAVEAGASLVARGLLLEGNHDVGLGASGTWTTVDLVDATIRDTLPLPDGTFGRGIVVQNGAGLVARSLLLDGNHDVGLVAWGAGAIADLQDVAILDTQPLPDGSFGRGIAATWGASLVARGLLLERNHDVGLYASEAGTSVDLEDATVRDTQPLPDGTDGSGIAVQDGASLVARGLLLDGNHDVGLFVTGPGAVVDLEDGVASGTRGAYDSAGGSGVSVQNLGLLSARGLEVQDNEGPGLYVVTGGVFEARDAALRRNGFAGAVVLGAHLALRDGEVSGSFPHPSEGGGVGLFAWNLGSPSSLDVQSVTFSDLAGPALYLRGPGRYIVRDCEITGTGSTPRLPGGVLALEGVEPWHEVGDTGSFTGLHLQGNSFHDLPSDAILLDSSSLTLDLSRRPGTPPNTFGSLGGVPLLWQRCDDVAPPEVLDGSTLVPDCEPVPRTLGPAMEYRLWVTETEPVE